MRRMMIEKLAGHIADFTPRLRSNTRAIYQFVPLPKLEYPQLENELFCPYLLSQAFVRFRQISELAYQKPCSVLERIVVGLEY